MIYVKSRREPVFGMFISQLDGDRNLIIRYWGITWELEAVGDNKIIIMDGFYGMHRINKIDLTNNYRVAHSGQILHEDNEYGHYHLSEIIDRIKSNIGSVHDPLCTSIDRGGWTTCKIAFANKLTRI